MARKKPKPDGVCVYCGDVGKVTKDHVPPEGIYPDPKPTERIWVPACERCNKGFQPDDDYFITRMGLNDKARGHPDIPKKTETIIKALRREEAPGFRAQFLKDRRTISFTHSGLYIGPQAAFHVDLQRVFNVIQRTIRGLFFKETNGRLPEKDEIRVWCDETFAAEDRQNREDLKNWFLAPLMMVEPKVIGPDLFSYRHIINDDLASAWILGFYGRIHFLAITFPAAEE